MNNIKFSILITTKNRCEDLLITLRSISYLLDRKDVECIVYDDASSDNTVNALQNNFPSIKLLKNNVSKGLIYNRNVLLEHAKGEFAISLDDDLNFLTENPLEIIQSFFDDNEDCAIQSFRIYWDINKPECSQTNLKPYEINSFAGGAHVVRLKYWKHIPKYPDWFVFYGEEDFASYHLFKKGYKIFFNPNVLTHHRVAIKNRINENDFQERLRRSIRVGWYLYFMFYPWKRIPKVILYSFWSHFKSKVIKGDFKTTFALFQAIFDFIINFPKIIKNSNRLTSDEFQKYSKLKPVLLYWKPEDEK